MDELAKKILKNLNAEQMTEQGAAADVNRAALYLLGGPPGTSVHRDALGMLQGAAIAQVHGDAGARKLCDLKSSVGGGP